MFCILRSNCDSTTTYWNIARAIHVSVIIMYIGIIILSFPYGFTSAMFRWLKDGSFDCTVGIAIDNTPVAIGIFVHDRLVITSANALSNMPKHRINIYVVNGSAKKSRKVTIDHITMHKARNKKWVWVDLARKHTPIHDIALISVIDDDTVYPRNLSLSRRPYYIHLADRDSKPERTGWTFAGFGFANKRHIKNSNKLQAVIYTDQVKVDCDQYLPPGWGYFICILNIKNFAGVQAGAPLIHQNTLFGIGCFTHTKHNESIFVFTDVRYYRGKLVYLYSKNWWWGT